MGQKRTARLYGHAIDCNREKDIFPLGIGMSAGIYDRALKEVMGAVLAKEETSLILQGICSGDKYIYHALYSHENKKEKSSAPT